MTYIAPSRLGNCTGCGSAIQLSATSSPRPFCLACRRVGAAPSKERHGISKYRKGCRCDTCRAAVATRTRERNALRRASGTLADYRLRTLRTCENCTAEYPARTDGRGRFCSTECAKEFQGWTGTRRPDKFPMTPSRRLAIYERDAWVCQICHEPVDINADSSSNWFPSLDHVHPRSRGGDNSDENLRTAHRVCNSRKGALVGV